MGWVSVQNIKPIWPVWLVQLNDILPIYPSNPKYINLLVVVVYFPWHIVIDYLWYWDML